MSRLHGITPKNVLHQFVTAGQHSIKCVVIVQATTSRKMSDIENLDETSIEDLASIHFPQKLSHIRQEFVKQGGDKQRIIRWSLEVVDK